MSTMTCPFESTEAPATDNRSARHWARGETARFIAHLRREARSPGKTHAKQHSERLMRVAQRLEQCLG